MKQISCIVGLSMAALSICSCAIELQEDFPAGEYEYTFTAGSYDSSDTKSYIADGHVCWEEGDKVGVFVERIHGNLEYYEGSVNPAEGESPATVTFKSAYALEEGDILVARYPYVENWNSGGLSLQRVTVPDSQTTETEMQMVSIPFTVTSSSAEGDQISGDFRFCNMGALLKFQIYSSDDALKGEKVISVSIANSDDMAGVHGYNFLNFPESFGYTHNFGGRRTVTSYNTGTEYTVGGKNPDGNTIPMIVLPCTLKEGMCISIRTDKALYQKWTTSDVQIQRSMSYTLGIDLSSMGRSEMSLDEEKVSNDKAALIAIYNALGGDKWNNNQNWCSDLPLDAWYGVSTNSDGTVYRINLRNNNLTGTLPAECGKLTAIAYLDLAYNSISSDEVTTAPSTLVSVFMSGNPLSSFPSWILSAGSLESLALYGCNINGEIPEEIGNLTQMGYLDLGSNNFSGTIPESIYNLTELVSLFLSSNQLTGGISSSIGNLTELRILSLEQNQLSGPLPEAIGNCTKLEDIYLFSNKFSESIPSSIGNLKDLRTLCLYRNELSGTIPSTIGNCINLTYIGLDNNKLSGEIPSSISALSNLITLHLHSNELEGNIPAEFSTMPVLQKFSTFGNKLSGSIPTEIRNSRFWNNDWGYIIMGNDLTIENAMPSHPEFTSLSTTTNETITPEIFSQNELTVLFQWSSDCIFTDMPMMQEIYDLYKSKGLDVIGYAPKDEAYMQTTLSANGITFRNFSHMKSGNDICGYLENGDNRCITTPLLFPYMTTPEITVYDKTGTLVFSDLLESRSNFTSFVESYFSDGYVSTDFSADKSVKTLQSASSGSGINIVLMGDGFSDRQIASGEYEKQMNNAYNALFSEEPFKSYQGCFNVKYIVAVSKDEGFTDGGETVFSTTFGEGTYMCGDHDKVFEYGKAAIGDDDNAMLIVLANKRVNAGTCYMYSSSKGTSAGDYGEGASVSYFASGTSSTMFTNLILHEAVGHGFAKLGDEYSYAVNGTIPAETAENYKKMEPYGWWKNIDFTNSDPGMVKWAQFISDATYSTDEAGVYEGGMEYPYGLWHSTEDSRMNTGYGHFNAVSRHAIWYRINKLANGESWNGTYSDFVTYDAVNRTSAAITSRQGSRSKTSKEERIIFTPPVLMGKH
ncbi:MAG: M64 family metallopeptidase [Candidatus Cryptobacteroides sp.]